MMDYYCFFSLAVSLLISPINIREKKGKEKTQKSDNERNKNENADDKPGHRS